MTSTPSQEAVAVLAGAIRKANNEGFISPVDVAAVALGYLPASVRQSVEAALVPVCRDPFHRHNGPCELYAQPPNQPQDSLSAAWEAAEKALPVSGWPAKDGRWVIPNDLGTISIQRVASGDGYFEPYLEGYNALVRMNGPEPFVRQGFGPTPAAALIALAAALRSETKEGDK